MAAHVRASECVTFRIRGGLMTKPTRCGIWLMILVRTRKYDTIVLAYYRWFEYKHADCSVSLQFANKEIVTRIARTAFDFCFTLTRTCACAGWFQCGAECVKRTFSGGWVINVMV